MKLVYSIIVPCFNEEETVNKFYDAICPVVKKLDGVYEIIFINDGSRDKTAEMLLELAKKDKNVKVINFSRNFGQQAGILAGFKESSGDAMIVIDVDLQDPVDSILDMTKKWREGFDIVHGKRLVRKGETFLKKRTASLYTKFFAKITGLKIPKNCGDFKLFDRKVVDTIISMPEHNRFMRGITEWVGFKQGYVEFERQERVAGKTKFNAKKLFKLATDGIVSNGNYPITLALKTGVCFGILSCLALLTFVVLAICKISIPLVAWLFAGVVLLFALSFVFRGLSDIYLSRVYTEVQNRPKYIISSKINFEKD